jgi:heptosyltransferase I
VKALIVRLSSIGDVVHTLPLLGPLARHGWRVGWLTEPASQPLLADHALVDHVTMAPAARAFSFAHARRAAGALRAQRYDVALDVQGLWKSAVWARLAGAGRVIGPGPSARREPWSAWLARERIEPPADARHVIDKNLALLRPLGIDGLGAREFGLPRFELEAGKIRQQLGGMAIEAPVAVLNPGGGWESKRWPPERFGALAVELRERGLVPVVTWGPGEERLAERVVAASGGTARRCFATSLRELVELLRCARLVVANDTGPLQLACAVGAPVVALFGPTDPVRNGPFSPADETVRSIPPCAPCHRRRCPVHEGVMSRIEVAEVVAAVDRRLAGAPTRIAL